MPISEEKYAERLAEVIRWSNLSANAFAKHIGLKKGENVYQVLRGNHGISNKLANTIAASYPQINPLWLRTGIGTMIVMERQRVDFYDLDVECNISNLEESQPAMQIVLPIKEESDFAMIYNGLAMGEVIPVGSTVVLQRVDPETIIPGKEYLVVSDRITALRVVRAPIIHNEKRATWRLVATDREKFDDIEIERKSIKSAYRVVAKLIINY